MFNELIIFQSCRLCCKQRCVIVVVPVSFDEFLTSYMELTEDFPISYPVPLEEYWKCVLKRFTAIYFQNCSSKSLSFVIVLNVMQLTYMSVKLTSNPMNSSPFKSNNLLIVE